MVLDRQNIEAKADDWIIPLWVKVTITLLTVSAGVVFVLAILGTPKILMGVSTEGITTISFGLAFGLILVTLVFWFLPKSAFALFVYWLIRLFKTQIGIFAVLGIVYLMIARTAVFSFRGGIPLINLILLCLMSLFVQPVTAKRFPLPWMEKLYPHLEKQINRINAIPVWALSVAVAFLPILIICSIIYVVLDASFLDYRPYSFWNDETGYWTWVRSFSHVGFNTGYNTPDELVAPAAFNRYGEGSPFYIYLYGAIGRLLGWSDALPIFINFVILALAIIFFIHSTKISPVQIIFIGLITILTWPILLYLPMTTHETLNQVIGFVLAIVFFKLLTGREQVGLTSRIMFTVLVYLAALIRLSWGLFLIPVLFYCLNGNIFQRILLAVLLGSGLYLSVILITSYLVPPANNSIFLNINESLDQGPAVLIEHVRFQFFEMFRFRRLNPNIAVLFQTAVIIVWNTIRLIRLIKQRLSTASILQSRSVFDIYNVTTLAVAGLFFYLQEGFYRTFTPSLLIVYLLQATRKDYRLLGTLLAINLVFFHSYMTFYAHQGDAAIIRADFTTEFSERAQLQSQIADQIVFDQTAQSPWCNTLLIPLHYYDYRLTLIPPGIGVSYFEDPDNLNIPMKSKYLLLDQEAYEEFAGRLNAKFLESYLIGDLYYNLDSSCELNQQSK